MDIFWNEKPGLTLKERARAPASGGNQKRALAPVLRRSCPAPASLNLIHLPRLCSLPQPRAARKIGSTLEPQAAIASMAAHRPTQNSLRKPQMLPQPKFAAQGSESHGTSVAAPILAGPSLWRFPLAPSCPIVRFPHDPSLPKRDSEIDLHAAPLRDLSSRRPWPILTLTFRPRGHGVLLCQF
jgi:hypothetical protein